MNNTTNLSNLLQIRYDAQMLKVLEFNLVFKQFGTAKSQPLNSGKEVAYNRFNNLGALTTPLGDGIVPAPQTLGTTKITATLAQYGGFVNISDFIETTAVSSVVTNAIDRLAYQAALSVDTIMRNEADANGTNVYANGAANNAALTSSDKFIGKEANNAARTLELSAVEPLSGGSYGAIIHPNPMYDFIADNSVGGFLYTTQYSDPSKIYNKEVGKMYNIRFSESQNCTTSNNGTCNTYNTYIFGMEALGDVELSGGQVRTIVKNASSGGTNDPLEQINTVGWKATFAPKVLQPLALLVYQAGSAL